MDFHSMKRKQLQALCKKHKIPANLSNLEMANRLTEFLKASENPVIQGVVEEEENGSEIEAKKMRISPEIKGRSRKDYVYCVEGDSSVEIVKSGEWKKATMNRRGNESNVMEAEVKQKKTGVKAVKAVKCIDGPKIAAAASSLDNDELEEADVVRSGGVMPLRGKMAVEGVKDANKRGRKRGKCDDKRDENNPSRVTRSRAKKLTELTSDGSKVDVEIVEISGTVEPPRRSKRKTMVESGVLRVETENRYPLRSSLLQSVVVPEGNVAKNSNDVNCGAQSSGGRSRVKVGESHHGSLGTGESLFLDVQLSVSKDSETAKNLCSKNIISDVELREIHKEKEEVSIAHGTGSSCMNLTNGEDLVNSDTNAASKSAEQRTDTSVSDDQNSTRNIVEVEDGTLLLEDDVEESMEPNITEVDKNDPEAQVHSQMEDSSGHNNKINDQVLAECLNVSGGESSAETFTSTDSFLLGDQTVAQTDLKVAETEADKRVQPCVGVVSDHNNKDTSQTFGEDGSFESCSMTRHHGDNAADGDETFFHKGRASELVEADEDGCLKDRRNASNRLSAFDMADLSNGERDATIDARDRGIFADEYIFMDSNVYATPIAISTISTDVNLKRDREDDHIYESTNSEVAETRESESSKDHMSKCDEDGEFSLSKFFDEEGRYGITPQERENFSPEHSVKDFNEQAMLHGSPSLALPTICNISGDHEANLKNKQSEWTEADISGWLKSQGKSSNSQETNPYTPSSVSETQEKQKSLLAKSNALANTNQRQGAWSNTIELAGNAMRFLKSSEENISQALEGLSCPDEYVNHASYCIEKEAFAKATSSDVQSCLVSKITAESFGDAKFQASVETEHQHGNLLVVQTDAGGKATHATSRQSWTETELQNMFGTSDEDDHLRLGGTCYQGSERTDMSISMNKSTASNCDSMTKEEEKEMDGGSSHKCAETKNKNTIFPSAFDADIYENEFKVMLATPNKITTTCKIGEAYSHCRVLNRSVMSIKECSYAMKGNVVTESTSNEKTQDAGSEVENKSSIGASLSDNGWDDVCEEINKVESFELSPTRVLSEADYVGCEALDAQLSQHKEECLDENISMTMEDWEEHVIPLEQSCLNGEATDSPRDLNELENCAQKSEMGSRKRNAHNKSEGEMTQSTTELSNADLQKIDVLENSRLLTGCSLDGDNVSESSVETSSDPEVSNNGSSEKDMTGISLFLCLKASLDCEDLILEGDDQYEAKKLDEDNVNPESSQDIPDELPNNEVANQESVSIGYNTCQDQLPSSDELESTCKEANGMETTTQNLYNTDVAAEHETFVCGTVTGLVSNLEAGGTAFNLDIGKVQDAQVEHVNNFCIGHVLSDGGGEDNCGKIDDVETVALKFTSTAVLSKTEYDGCEASGKQLTEITGDCQKETNFMTEDNEERVISLGQSCLFDEEVDNDTESTEKDINSLSGTPNNLDKHEGQDMLNDTALGDSLSFKTSVDHKSEEITQCSEAAVELSGVNLQESNTSKNSQDAIDEGTYLHLSPKPSTFYTNTDGLNGVKICGESHINSDVAILKGLSDSDHQSEEAGVACFVERESMFVATEEAGMTAQDLNIIVAPTEHDSPVCSAVSGILSRPEKYLHLRDANSCIKNMDMSINKKDSEKEKENSTSEIVRFSIQELHCEENVEDFKEGKVEENSGSKEEYINCLSGTPNNLDKHEGCQDMLIETALGESLSCKISVDHNSEPEMMHCSEGADELSDADLHKSNITKNSQDVIDEGTCLLLSPNASSVYNELTQNTNADDCNGAKICDEIHSEEKSSHDMPVESHINSEGATPKCLSDSGNQSEEVKLDCSLGLESTFVKTEGIGTTTMDDNIVAPTEYGSLVCGSVSSILSSSKLHLHQRDESSIIKNLDVGKHIFMSIDNEMKDSEKAEENSTSERVQFFIQELHCEENVEDFKNDTPTISNLPPTGYNEILKESDVADAIKEYADSESSLSMMFENSSGSLPSDILAHTDEAIAGSKHEDKAPSVDILDAEIQEQEEATLLTTPDDFLDEGTTAKLESQRKIESESLKELGSIMKKNARTILIHGTPGKENVPAQKRSNVGDVTAVRPAKRRALQDLQSK